MTTRDPAMRWFPGIEATTQIQFGFIEKLSQTLEENNGERVRLLTRIRNQFQVEEIFNEDIMSLHGLQRKFWDILRKKFNAVPNPQCSNSTRYQYKWANTIYPGEAFEEERKRATAIIDKYVQGDGESPRSTSSTSSINTNNDDLIIIMKNMGENLQMQNDLMKKIYRKLERTEENNTRKNTSQREISIHDNSPTLNHRTENNRIHHDVAMRFRNKENKYGGTDKEDLEEFIDEYSAMAFDYNLNDSQKCQFIHNLLKLDALRYYNRSIKRKATTYQETIQSRREHFNSSEAQIRIKMELQSLKFSEFITETGSASKALSKLTEKISNDTPKCPKNFRSEDTKIEFIKKALITYP